jgi:PAS domain S-box-containing protein
MDNIFSSIASGVITADIEDKVLLCNRATEDILGLKRVEMLHQRLAEALPSLAVDLVQHIQQVRLYDQRILGIEVTPILPERGKVTLSLNLSPLKDADQHTQGVAIVVDDLTEKKRLEAQRSMFERMVSPKVIEQLDPEKMQLGGRLTEITTLFADVRGFTAFSERYDPEELLKILNQYMSEAGRIILDEEGTIDKFMGDAVMAWFNAPIPQPDHPLRAIRAAIAIVAEVERLHALLPEEFHLNFGVGIHFGPAVLGMVGTEKKMEYTAIGDSVNTAKRIQENAKGGQVLISEDVYRLLEGQVVVGNPKGVDVKGKAQPVTVFEVLKLAA